MIRTLAAIAMLVLASTAVASAATGRSPAALYNALLTKPFPDGQLPSGFSSARVSLHSPSASARHYHVVGAVDVVVDGPDPDDGIGFDIYPNHADALASINHPSLTSGEKLHIVPGGVPTFPKLAGHMWTGSFTGKNLLGKTVTNGVTIVVVVQGNATVEAFTDSADSTDSGNVPAALQLLRAALRHLAKA